MSSQDYLRPISHFPRVDTWLHVAILNVSWLGVWRTTVGLAIRTVDKTCFDSFATSSWAIRPRCHLPFGTFGFAFNCVRGFQRQVALFFVLNFRLCSRNFTINRSCLNALTTIGRAFRPIACVPCGTITSRAQLILAWLGRLVALRLVHTLTFAQACHIALSSTASTWLRAHTPLAHQPIWTWVVIAFLGIDWSLRFAIRLVG